MERKGQPLKTSEVMKAASVGRNTLRFYEEKGLIAPVSRADSGYRLYSEETLRDLQFISQAKESGFTLEEIKDLLAICRNNQSTCGTISTKLELKISETERLIAALEEKKALLCQFLMVCHRKSELNHCDIRNRGLKESACCG